MIAYGLLTPRTQHIVSSIQVLRRYLTQVLFDTEVVLGRRRYDASVDYRALGVDFETGLVGRHAVMNLLAALAVARVFEIPPERLRDAVRTFSTGKMRG